ncbi:MAG: RluA family pseudouridine synthase [Chthonomonadales bacterium]|nr:RluA family pseudouridine synthase [Chthonomonadales bacterium]
MHRWRVGPEAAGQRLDLFVAAGLGGSRAEAQKAISAGSVRVDGAVRPASHRLREGASVELEPAEPRPPHVAPEPIPLTIVYEDADLLVVNKPRGMVVHPGAGNPSGTLANAILAHAPGVAGVGGETRPGIVHRLDKDTSGLLAVAKTENARASLQRQIEARTAERRYEAVVWGSPRFERAVVDAPIGRHPGDRKKMAVVTDPRQTARPAVTQIIVEERLGPFSRIQARLQTGRTHQIRVHCAYAGHPVVGDPQYGGERRVPAQGVPSAGRARVEAAVGALHGQALHARHLAFDHPTSGERLRFEVAAPAPLRELIQTLRDVYGGPSGPPEG